MRFLSVCSGIEAASVAWGPLGWKAVAFSEIESYSCHLLHHRYGSGRPHHMPSPDDEGLSACEIKARRAAINAVKNLPIVIHGSTPANWGDMNNYKEWPDVSIDLLCGGTPCQSFSVAGLRSGLADPRGNLMLTFGAIAAKYRPRWLGWENVPGVLSSAGGADFASFLGLLTGQIVKVPAGGWANSGVIAGIADAYGIAWRVFDAQYFGVPQRRRRVFVVGCLGDWRSAAAVLFERHSVSGHPAPRRQAGQVVTPTVRAGAANGGAGHVARSGDSKDELIVPVAGTLQANGKAAGNATQQDAESGMLVPIAFGGNNTAGPIDVATARNACASGSGRMDFESETFLVSHSLRGEGFDASEDGTGRGTPLVPVSVPTLVSNGDAHSGFRDEHGLVPVLAFDTTQVTSAANRSNPKAGDPCHPLAAGAHAPGIAYSTKLHNTQSNQAGKVYEEYAAGLDRNSPPPALLTALQVRRLTPMECERLQGFPDGYTLIPVQRGKPAADGPRYKALGNSWAIPNVRWIGERIDAVSRISRAQEATNSIAEMEAA